MRFPCASAIHHSSAFTLGITNASRSAAVRGSYSPGGGGLGVGTAGGGTAGGGGAARSTGAGAGGGAAAARCSAARVAWQAVIMRRTDERPSFLCESRYFCR